MGGTRWTDGANIPGAGSAEEQILYSGTKYFWGPQYESASYHVSGTNKSEVTQNYLENVFPPDWITNKRPTIFCRQILPETAVTMQTTEEQGALYFGCLEAIRETGARSLFGRRLVKFLQPVIRLTTRP